MKKTLIVAAVSASFASAANAQSSVTLYGLIDAGFTYVNNVENQNVTNGNIKASRFGVTSGNLQGSRWGLRGAEDLGGGMKAIFTLESGFNIANGQAGQRDVDGNGRMFGRQAFVGLSGNFGSVTLGRQYDSVVDYLAPMTANGSWGGTYFSHPFDNDNTDNTFRINNSVKYQSANYGGFSFGGMYGFSNSGGAFSANRAYSAGAGYAYGPFKVAAAYLQTQGTDSANKSGAINEQLTGSGAVALIPNQSQRTYGVGASYSVGALTFGGAWTQSRFQYDLLDTSSRFNNYEVNARYNVTPALAIGGSYTYTDLKGYAPLAFGSDNDNGHVKYHQFGLQADYALSKRTDFYAEGVVQLARSSQRDDPRAAVYGAGSSTSGNQVVVSTGIRHRF
jgi:GBP family porin